MSDIDAKRSTTDRRIEERHFACFPAHIQRAGGSTRMALIRDLSVSGALLLTRQKLAVGDEVILALYLTEDMDKARRAPAKVVRVEERDVDHAEVWHFSTAVQFEELLTDCEAEIKDLADRQLALGIPRD